MLQSHYLEPLDSIIVAPIVRDAARPMSVLDVAVEIDGEALVMTVGELFSIERDLLKVVRSTLASQEDQVRRAIERAFTGV